MTFITALILGLQTSISPCPLTANITAVSYIGRQAGQRNSVLLSGLLYAAGQMTAYTVLAFFVIGLSRYSGSEITRFFTATLHRCMPTFFIVIGIILLGNRKASHRLAEQSSYSEKTKENNVTRSAVIPLPCRPSSIAVLSAFPLGVFYALAFCPTTAAMFLAMLAVAMENQSLFAVPIGFGLGTALPVVVLAYLLTFSTQYFAQTFNALEYLDAYSRPFTGIVFIAAGIILRVM